MCDDDDPTLRVELNDAVAASAFAFGEPFCSDDVAVEPPRLDASMREMSPHRPELIFSLYFQVTIFLLTGRGEPASFSISFNFRFLAILAALAFTIGREGSGVGVLTTEGAAGVRLPAGRLCTDIVSPCSKATGRGAADTSGWRAVGVATGAGVGAGEAVLGAGEAILGGGVGTGAGDRSVVFEIVPERDSLMRFFLGFSFSFSFSGCATCNGAVATAATGVAGATGAGGAAGADDVAAIDGGAILDPDGSDTFAGKGSSRFFFSCVLYDGLNCRTSD